MYQKMIDYNPGITGTGIILQDGSPLNFMEWKGSADAPSIGAFN